MCRLRRKDDEIFRGNVARLEVVYKEMGFIFSPKDDYNVNKMTLKDGEKIYSLKDWIKETGIDWKAVQKPLLIMTSWKRL